MNRIKEKIQFGIDSRKKLTGADLYVKIFQLASMFPVLYVFMTSGYISIFSKTSVFSVLFDLGISVLPRLEVLPLSYLYRATSNEITVIFVMLFAGLILGLLAGKLFREDFKRGIRARKAFMALIGIDLIARLVPMRYNLAFGWPMAIIGFIIRLACGVFLYLDLKDAGTDADKVRQNEKHSDGQQNI